MEYISRLRISTKFVWGVLMRKPCNFCKPTNAFYSSAVNPICGKYLAISPFLTSRMQYAKRAQGKMSKGGKPKTVKLTDEEMLEVIDIGEYRNQLLLEKEKLKKDLIDNISLRSASNIENVLVKIEDQEYPLHELAQISRKNQNLIAINMIDFPEALKPAIQAITESGIGVNLQQEATMLYLTIPKLTREHRESLAKSAKSLFMKSKEEVRNIQNYFVKDAKRKSDLSEDLVFNASNQIMHIAEETVAELEKMLKIKQKELLGEK